MLCSWKRVDKEIICIILLDRGSLRREKEAEGSEPERRPPDKDSNHCWVWWEKGVMDYEKPLEAGKQKTMGFPLESQEGMQPSETHFRFLTSRSVG